MFYLMMISTHFIHSHMASETQLITIAEHCKIHLVRTK